MILEENWQEQLKEIDHRFYSMDEDGIFEDNIYPEDVEFLLNLIAELKKVAF